MACLVMAYVVTAYIVTAHILTAHIAVAYVVMAYVSMAECLEVRSEEVHEYGLHLARRRARDDAPQQQLDVRRDELEQLLGRVLPRDFENLGACRRRTPRTRVDLKVPEDASHRDPSDATLRFDLAIGVRRRYAPKGF